MPVKHVVGAQETLIGISEIYGLFVETIWDHPDNADLRGRRGDMNVLLAGDVVVIPEKREKALEVASGQRHTFRRRGIPALFRLQLFDAGEPRAGQSFELTLEGKASAESGASAGAGGARITGKTDGNGVLEVAVPARAQRGVLVVGPDHLTVEIRFGELDPPDTPSGIRHRLSNLGFEGDEQEAEETKLHSALLAFQKRFDLPRTGEADAQTIEKLALLHDQTGEVTSAEV